MGKKKVKEQKEPSTVLGPAILKGLVMIHFSDRVTVLMSVWTTSWAQDTAGAGDLRWNVSCLWLSDEGQSGKSCRGVAGRSNDEGLRRLP